MCCCVKRVASICPSRQQAQASAPSSNFLFQEGIHPCRVHLWQRFAFVICLAALADILHFDFGVFQFPNARFHGLMPFLQHAVTLAQCRITLANQVKKAFDFLEFQSRMLKASQPRQFFHFLAVEDTASRPVSRDVQDSFFFKKRRLDGVVPVNSETSEKERHMSFCFPSSDASCMKTRRLFLRLRETTISVYGRGSRLLLPF